MSESVPSAEPVPTPAPVEAPAVVEAAPTPVVEAAPAPEAPALHTDTPTLMEQPATEPVKEEPKAPEPVAAPAAPTYEFKFEDGFKAEPEQLTALSTALGKFNVDQETAQGLVEMHQSALKKYAEAELTRQHMAFGSMRKEWVAQIKSDPVLGGAGFETTQRAVAEMRDKFVPKTDQPAFNEMLRVTGVGDHPAFWRLLHNAARFFKEPAMPPPNIQPPPGVSGAKPSIYDHPTSRAGAR